MMLKQIRTVQRKYNLINKENNMTVSDVTIDKPILEKSQTKIIRRQSLCKSDKND